MMIDSVLANMQEAEDGLNTMHALADMALAVEYEKPDDPRKDYLTHMALMVHSIACDVDVALSEAVSEIMG